MNGNRPSRASGQECDEQSPTEGETNDDGLPRRQFLGAAAALSALPTVSQGAEGGSEAETVTESRAFSAGVIADAWEPAAGFDVETYPDEPDSAVSVKFTASFGTVHFGMGTAAAEEFAEEIRAAVHDVDEQRDRATE